MTTYRLPDALGRGEVEMVDTPVVVEGTPVRIESGHVLLVPMSLLTEVKPPVPPEPRNFSTVRVGARAYVRDDDVPSLRTWRGPDGPYTWEELCGLATKSTGFPPVLLTPVQPVEIPWVYDDDSASADATTVHIGHDSGCKPGEAYVRLIRGAYVLVAYVPARTAASALCAVDEVSS